MGPKTGGIEADDFYPSPTEHPVRNGHGVLKIHTHRGLAHDLGFNMEQVVETGGGPEIQTGTPHRENKALFLLQDIQFITPFAQHFGAGALHET